MVAQKVKYAVVLCMDAERTWSVELEYCGGSWAVPLKKIARAAFDVADIPADVLDLSMCWDVTITVQNGPLSGRSFRIQFDF